MPRLCPQKFKLIGLRYRLAWGIFKAYQVPSILKATASGETLKYMTLNVDTGLKSWVIMTNILFSPLLFCLCQLGEFTS